jgi:hypothetical protein
MSLKIAEATLTTPQSGDSCPLQRDGDDTPYRFDPSALGGSGLPLQLPIQDGRYYRAVNADEFASAVTTDTFDGQIVATPFIASQRKTWTKIGMSCTTDAAGIHARVGIYSSDPSTGLPDALIIDAGELDFSSTGDKEITISQELDGNTLYWLACVMEASAVAECRSIDFVPNNLFFYGADDAAGSSLTSEVVATQAYGSLPSSFGAASFTSSGSAPLIWLRTGV